MFRDRKAQYCDDVNSSQLDIRFKAMPIKIPVSYFVNIGIHILKFVWRCKRPRRANTTLKENNVRGQAPPDFKTYIKLQ